MKNIKNYIGAGLIFLGGLGFLGCSSNSEYKIKENQKEMSERTSLEKKYALVNENLNIVQSKLSLVKRAQDLNGRLLVLGREATKYAIESKNILEKDCVSNQELLEAKTLMEKNDSIMLIFQQNKEKYDSMKQVLNLYSTKE